MASTMRFDKWENPTGTLSLDITQATPGIVPIYPSSLVVAGGTASTSGVSLTTFTNITSLGLRNVFSTAYKTYKVVLTITGTTGAVGDFYFRLGNSGTTSNSNYQWQCLRGYSTTVSASQSSSGTEWWVGQAWASTANADRPVLGTYEISNPMMASRTVFTGICGGDNAYNVIQQNFSGLYNTADTFTDLFIIPSGQSFSGTVQVYGYR